MDLIFMFLPLLIIIVYFYIRQKSKHNKLCELFKNISDLNLSTNCFKDILNVSIPVFSIFVVVLCLTATAFSPVLSGTTAAAENSVLSKNTISQTSTINTGDNLYYASSKSNVYHVAGCRYVSQIKPENLITFSSIQEAEKAGYRPCSVCIGATPKPAPTPTPDPTPTPTPTPTPAPVSGNLTIHFIDVGQGDSILLEYGNHDMLIDAGEMGKGDVVEKYLNGKGVKSLDYVVATHPHSDHIGGMSVILNDFPIAHFLDCGYAYTSKTYEDMLTTIGNKGIPFSTPKRGDKIDFSSGIDIQVLNPGSIYFTDDVNQNSIALKVTDGKVTFLLMGDAGIEAENSILEAGYNVDADILKVGHHGSNSASGDSFISAVSPLVSVIEVGANNEYGQPHLETLQKLQKVSTVYRTDLDGTVTVTTDGSTYSVTTEKTANSNRVDPLFPVADFTANPLIGSSPLSVQFTDISQNAVSRSWDFNNDGTADSRDVSPVYTYTSPGTYTVNFTVSNSNGTKSKLTTITVLDESSSSGSSSESGSGSSSDDSSSGGGSSGGSSSSSGGSGGGGGAGGSPEPQENVETKELSQTFVGSGQSIKFEFPQKVTPVVYVSFDSKKTTGKTTTIVELLKKQSSLVSASPSDEVYKHLNIWVGNSGFATPDNIENASVEYKVDKSWIQDKNIDKSSITLNRFSDTKWNVLPTSLTGEDDKYLYFTAQTPGFSPFAITGKAANEDANTLSPETQTGPNIGSLVNNTSNTINVKQAPEQPQSPSKKTPGFEAVCGIIGLFGLFLCRRR